MEIISWEKGISQEREIPLFIYLLKKSSYQLVIFEFFGKVLKSPNYF